MTTTEPPPEFDPGSANALARIIEACHARGLVLSYARHLGRYRIVIAGPGVTWDYITAQAWDKPYVVLMSKAWEYVTSLPMDVLEVPHARAMPIPQSVSPPNPEVPLPAASRIHVTTSTRRASDADGGVLHDMANVATGGLLNLI